MTMAFAPLSLPPMEEAMEMSSPAAGQQFDGDIDIDFGDYAGDQINDDEHMIEDGDPIRPGTAVTDDMMADIDQPQVMSIPNTVEEEMQDSDEAAQPVEQQMNDEELIDYEDEVYPDQPQEAPVGTTLEAQAQNTSDTDATDAPGATAVDSGLLTEANPSTEHDPAEEQIVRRPEALAVESTVDTLDVTAPDATNSPPAEPSDNVTLPPHEDAEIAPQNTLDKIAAPSAVAQDPQPADEAPSSTAEDVGVSEQAVSPTGEHEQIPEQEVNGPSQKLPPQHLRTIDVSGSRVTDVPLTPTDQTLHALLISFGEYQWPLFKSRSQPDGLLKDDNLLNVSLTDLLCNVRERLALKVSADDMVAETRDLVLNFDMLGLMVAESSLHASATSLNDVLGVYLKLHENDGITERDAPPLFMTLTTQLNFSNSIASLKQLAATGAGLPSNPDQGDEDAVEFDQEDDATAEYQTEEAVQLKEGETTNGQEDDATEPEAQEALTGQIYEYYEEDHGEYEDHADYEEDDAEKDAPEPDDGDNGSFGEHEASDVVAEQTTSLSVATEGPGQSDAAVRGAEEIPEPKSDNSSDGDRAHGTNHSTGEYRPGNLIDWDGEDLTSDTSELHTDHGEDDDSPPLNADQSKPADEASDDAVNDHRQQGEAGAAVDGLELASDDFLDDGQPHNEGDEAAIKHEPDVAAGWHHPDATQSAEYKSHHDDSTAVLDDDRTEHVEDEEEFDTAFDLLDDDGNEPFQDNDDGAEIPDPSQAPELDEDDIGFDLDDDEVAPVSPSPTASTPQHGKRSLEEAADDDDRNDFDEPELKKARAD